MPAAAQHNNAAGLSQYDIDYPEAGAGGLASCLRPFFRFLNRFIRLRSPVTSPFLSVASGLLTLAACSASGPLPAWLLLTPAPFVCTASGAASPPATAAAVGAAAAGCASVKAAGDGGGGG